MRDETLTNLRLLSHVLCALLIGALYWDIGRISTTVNSIINSIFFVPHSVFFIKGNTSFIVVS